MTIQTTFEIVKYPNEILRQLAEPIEKEDVEVFELLKQMKQYVMDEKNNAAGLALPQVGVSKRGFVAIVKGKARIMINPKIIKKTGLELGTEGCLSIDEKPEGKVPRATFARITYRDENYKFQTIELRDWDVRVFLHEFDHLDGVLYTDRLVKEEQ